jgi:hypothetical protein
MTSIVLGYIFGDSYITYDREKALIDTLKAKPSVTFNPYDKPRCGYCNSTLAAFTDRCIRCGAPT